MHNAIALSAASTPYSENENLLILSRYGIQIPEMEQYGSEAMFYEFYMS